MSQLIKVSEWKGKRRASVIFVHGLGGHPYDTWRRGTGDVNNDDTFWPRWLAEDIKGLDIYTLGYEASAAGWTGQTMPLEDRAKNVAELLYIRDDLAEAPIFFVCHSLGGLIIKRLLLDLKERRHVRPEAEALLRAASGVVFMGTPHSGSHHAGVADGLRLLVWPSPLTKAMTSDAATLRSYNESYRILASDGAKHLSHKILRETRSTWLGKIVTEGSADPGLNNSESIGIDADHFSLVKPRDRQSLAYQSVRDFLEDALQKLAARRPPAGSFGIMKLPPFDGERSFHYMGAALRGVMLAALVFVGHAVWNQWFAAGRTDVPDEVRVFIALAAVDDIGERLRLAEMLLERPLTEQEKTLVANLQPEDDFLATIEPEQIVRIEKAANVEELNAAIASLNVQACGGSYTFKVEGPELRCKDGAPLPFVVSANFSEAPLIDREALIFHYTGTANTAAEIKLLAGAYGDGPKASVHLLISRDGNVIQFVPFDRRAWHAGSSKWGDLTGLNAYSIGISLSNLGPLQRQPDGTFVGDGRTVLPERVTPFTKDGVQTYWESFTPEQIKAAKAIVAAFRAIQPDIAVLGHCDVSKNKPDPGPAFPLSELRGSGQEKTSPCLAP